MSDAGSGDRSLRQALIVDELCSRFEACWRTDAPRELEPCLAEIPAEYRAAALSELLALEIQYRRQRGDEPHAAEYEARFPDCQDAISSGFRLAQQALADRTLEHRVVSEPDKPWAFKVRCPHCHSKIDVVEAGVLEQIHCSSCGSSFELVGDEALLYETAEGEQRRRQKISHFELLELLGSGAFGAVWKARDTELGRSVAVKIPRKGSLSREETELFLRDARAAAQLSHPHIVSVHEVGVEDNLLYIVSDLVDGVSLADYLVGQQFSLREAVKLCSTVAQALHHAHQSGVIHRDLKPSNIMLDARGEPHLIDFGLAKREADEVAMTVAGQVLGTPAFMSPEQAQGAGHKADRRSDIYSLGVVLFVLLTGERPFRGNVRMLLSQVIEDEPPSPRKLNGHVPRDLETICLKCLEKPPARRYATAQDLADELDRFLRGEPVLSRPVSRRERVSRWCKRKPLVAALAVTTALCAAAIVIGSPIWALRERQAAYESAARVRAEEDARRTQAENYLSASQLAGRRGDWGQALKELDSVEQLGAIPAVAVSLERLRALDALNDLGPWAAEIDRLEQLPQHAKYTSQIRLWQAIRQRSLGHEKESVATLQEAVRLGLPPADEAYAKALMARTTPETLALLEQALRYDPVHHSALSHYVGLLLYSGHIQRAKDQGSVGQVLFPQDPSFPLALAVIAALEGRPQDADKLLEACEEQFDEDAMREMRLVVKTWSTFAGVAAWQTDPTEILRALAKLYLSLGKRETRQVRKSGTHANARIVPLFEMPSTARLAFNKLAVAVVPFTASYLLGTIPGFQQTKMGDKAVSLLREAVEVHPEGTLYLILGLVLFQENQVAEAEAAFRMAAETPAILPQARRSALLMAGLEASILYLGAGNTGDGFQRAIGYWRSYIEEGTVEVEQVTWLLPLLIKAKETELLHQMIDRSLAKYPGNLRLLNSRAQMELASGNVGAAWETAREILRREPANKQALEIETKAAAELKIGLEPAQTPPQ